MTAKLRTAGKSPKKTRLRGRFGRLHQSQRLAQPPLLRRQQQAFQEFQLKVDALTEPVSNGGIYFHTAYQALSWPKQGFEVQVNQTHGNWKKTGSLYDVVNVKENFAQDLVWYSYHIIVNGKHVTIKINDKVAVDYEEPADRQPGKDFARSARRRRLRLSGARPKSTIGYTNVRVKRLP